MLIPSTLTKPMTYKKNSSVLFWKIKILGVTIGISLVSHLSHRQKIEQLGLDYRMMHRQVYHDDANVTRETYVVAALLQTNDHKSCVNNQVLNVCIEKRCKATELQSMVTDWRRRQVAPEERGGEGHSIHCQYIHL